jgi:hypothetical protein
MQIYVSFLLFEEKSELDQVFLGNAGKVEFVSGIVSNFCFVSIVLTIVPASYPSCAPILFVSR